MSGLEKGFDYGSFVSVKDGMIVKKTKDATTGKWVVLDDDKYKALSGYIRNILLEDKEFQNKPYKELQVIVDAPKSDGGFDRYNLNVNLHKNFGHGLIAALANADLTKEIKISPYVSKDKPADGMKPAVYCALRYAGEASTIPWVQGIPEIQKVDLPDGEVYYSKKDKNDFIELKVKEIQNKLKSIGITQTTNVVEIQPNMLNDEELEEENL